MITRGQLAAALYGTWLLMKLDIRAFDYFERTPGGFARSFLPAALLIPINLAHMMLNYDAATAKLAVVPYFVVELLSSILAVVAFPFVMLYVTELLAREPRYLWYMVPYNWFQLPLNLPLALIFLLTDLGIGSPQFAQFAVLVTLTLFFTYFSFIARIGLLVSTMTAIGIVFLDFLLTLLIEQLVSRI